MNIEKSLGRARDLLEAAGALRTSALRLGLHQLPIARLIGFLPTRTVTTLSLPLAAVTFGAGMVAGATAAALLTPQKGEELRSRLRSQLQTAWSKATGSETSAFAEGESALDELDRGEGEVRRYDEQLHKKRDREISGNSA